MRAEDVGWSENRMVLGKHSGRNAFRSRLTELGMDFESDEDLNRAFAAFKDLADKKHEIFDEDLFALVADEDAHLEEKFKLVSLRVCSDTNKVPDADLVLSIDGEEKSSNAAAAVQWTLRFRPSKCLQKVILNYSFTQ